IPTERLHGSIEFRNKALTYQFEGETLGGRFHLNGQIPTEKPKPAEAEPPQGRLRVEGARLGRLAEALAIQAGSQVVGCVLAIDITFQHTGPNREPIGNGRFSLDRLRWENTRLADTVQGDILLTEHELRFRNITGAVAQGLLRGQLVINL